ncbi:MAG: aminotransferase class I/II-fold pyridoxal phosphate-dependent enzyme [Acidobacteria bacterium]|nr:aminotransferase class I/II-fold pyridoxal phosphate-dependent enzyme [Acidobacteriota bacterium]
MMPQPTTPESALRLDLNEHTGGCAPEVAAALQALTATQLACYPDTAALTRAVAARFSVQPDEVLLTNGLDEGILMAAVACLGLRPHAALRQSAELGSPDARREMIVVTPVFDPYLQAAAAMQADAVIVPAGPDFQFPRQAVLDAITPQTRLIILNTPHNPTGSEIPIRAIAEVCAAAPHALVLVDEAYQDFGQTSCISALPSWPNAIVGRTFSKAYGLAGLRIGALIGAPALLAPMKRATPVFTLSTPAVTALETALQHDGYRLAYVDQVRQSRQRTYDVCARLGLRCWPSAGNFVLIDGGERYRALIDGLRARGIRVRDRSTDPSCPRCFRLTTGVLAHTNRALAALEDLCAAPQ